MAKIGEDMLGDMASLGFQELQAANAGQMAMDAPPIQPAEAPAAEPPAVEHQSYADMLNQAAMSPAPSQDMELSR